MQLRVTPLRVYNYVSQNPGQDPLIPPYLLSPISAAGLRQRIICLCQHAPAQIANDCARYESCVCGSVFGKVSERNTQRTRFLTLELDCRLLISCLVTERRRFTGQECDAAEFSLSFSSPDHHSQGELAAEGVFGASDLLSDLRCNGVHC